MDQTADSVKQLKTEWDYWLDLPTTPPDFIRIDDLDEKIGALETMLMDKSVYQSMACGDGALRLTRLQLPGAKAMDVGDIVRGRGDLFQPGLSFSEHEVEREYCRKAPKNTYDLQFNYHQCHADNNNRGKTEKN